jgi:hypothetical protein
MDSSKKFNTLYDEISKGTLETFLLENPLMKSQFLRDYKTLAQFIGSDDSEERNKGETIFFTFMLINKVTPEEKLTDWLEKGKKYVRENQHCERVVTLFSMLADFQDNLNVKSFIEKEFKNDIKKKHSFSDIQEIYNEYREMKYDLTTPEQIVSLNEKTREFIKDYINFLEKDETNFNSHKIALAAVKRISPDFFEVFKSEIEMIETFFK